MEPDTTQTNKEILKAELEQCAELMREAEGRMDGTRSPSAEGVQKMYREAYDNYQEAEGCTGAELNAVKQEMRDLHYFAPR